MADNVTLPGNTEVIGADDIGAGVKIQRAKVTWGPDGTANDADVATGKPLPVQLRGSDGADLASVGSFPVKDAGPNWTGSIGVSGARFTSADQSASAASVTDAPSSGEKICVDDLIISVDTDMRVDLMEETSGTVFASLYLPANSVQQVTPRGKFKLPTADKKLQVQTSAAGNISVTALYHSEA